MKNLLIIFLVLITSCHQGFKSEKDFLTWLNDESNGLLKSRSIGDVKISVKLLPAEYVAYKEYLQGKETGERVKDSLIDAAQKSLVFLLTVSTAGGAKNEDILTHGVYSINEYNSRATNMNFNMQQFISLQTDTCQYRPVLASMENSYGLSNYRTIYIVFSPKSSKEEFLQSESFDFVFQDDIFNTGLNHFVFHKDDINKIKPLHIWK